MEIELKFSIENIEKDATGNINDLIIDTTPDKISTLQTSLSTIKFKLSNVQLKEYAIGDEKILKE